MDVFIVAILPQNQDASLTAWCTLPGQQVTNGAVQEGTQKAVNATEEMSSIDACLIPEELALDFEEFLNDSSFDLDGDLPS